MQKFKLLRFCFPNILNFEYLRDDIRHAREIIKYSLDDKKYIRRVSLQLAFMPFHGEGEEEGGPVRKCSSCSSKFFPFNRDTN